MWLIGVFIGNLFFDDVPMEIVAILLVGGIFFTWLLNEIKMEIRYQRLVLMAEETHDN
jgi:predicted ATPase